MEFHADGERETVEEELVEVRDKAGTKHSRAVAEGREALRHVALAVVLAVTTVIAAITVSVKDGDSESPPRPVLPALLGGLTALAVLSAALRVGRVSLATPWHAADSSTTQRYSPGDVAGESGPEQEHGHEGEHSSGHGWRIVNRSPGARGREPGWMMGTPAALLIAAALAVVTQIVLRLVFAAPSSHFGGRIEDLDFGDKCASGGGNQTIERATNRAFDPNAESLGHWVSVSPVESAMGARIALLRMAREACGMSLVGPRKWSRLNLGGGGGDDAHGLFLAHQSPSAALGSDRTLFVCTDATQTRADDGRVRPRAGLHLPNLQPDQASSQQRCLCSVVLCEQRM